MVDRDVDGDAEVGVFVTVRCRERVGQIRGVVGCEGGGVARQDLKEIRSIADGGVVKRPVGFWNRPLIAFSVDGEDLRFQRIVSRDVKVLPGGNLIIHRDAERLGLATRNIDDNLRQFGLVPCFENLGSGLHRVPCGWRTGRQLPVRCLRPIIGWQNDGQTISAHVNPSGVDVNAVISSDGGR